MGQVELGGRLHLLEPVDQAAQLGAGLGKEIGGLDDGQLAGLVEVRRHCRQVGEIRRAVKVGELGGQILAEVGLPGGHRFGEVGQLPGELLEVPGGRRR